MNDNAGAIQQRVWGKLLTGWNVCDFAVVDEKWRGLLLEDHRYFDTQSGRVADEDFSKIANRTRIRYGDRNLHVVSAWEDDSEILSVPNSLEGYSSFKRDPALPLEYLMFGDSWKWLIYVGFDWCVLAGEVPFIDDMIDAYGGLRGYLDKLEREQGLPDPRHELNEIRRTWLTFIVRVLKISEEAVQEYWRERETEVNHE